MLTCVAAGRWGDPGGARACPSLAGNVCRLPPSPPGGRDVLLSRGAANHHFCARRRCACCCPPPFGSRLCCAAREPTKKNETGETLTGGGRTSTCCLLCCSFCRRCGCPRCVLSWFRSSRGGTCDSGQGRRICKHTGGEARTVLSLSVGITSMLVLLMCVRQCNTL